MNESTVFRLCKICLPTGRGSVAPSVQVEVLLDSNLLDRGLMSFKFPDEVRAYVYVHTCTYAGADDITTIRPTKSHEMLLTPHDILDPPWTRSWSCMCKRQNASRNITL